jgi:xanthine dehydrogenase YagS FAD-binding subunit
MKEGLSNPEQLISIREIEGLNSITYDTKEGLRIGANVTLSEIAANEEIKSLYLALHLAASKAATPQVRNMATLGGNLAQRTRCWYFRSKEHECFRKGSGTCYARYGENRYHAILDNEECASVHSSSLSTALMAFGAVVEIAGKDGKYSVVPLSKFFVLPSVDSTRESILEAGQIITSVIIPSLKEGTKSHYIKMGERESHDWPIADVAVVAEMAGTKCKKANIVLGAAAPVPVLSEAAMKTVKGKEINEDLAAMAGTAAMVNASPLAQNAYKVPIFETIIKRALMSLV